MYLTCKTVSSCVFGDVRIVTIDDLFPVYCATDVARLFGFKDPRGAVRYYCKSIGKLRYEGKRGVRKMNFISVADVNRLCKASRDPYAEGVCSWLLNEVPKVNYEVYEVKNLWSEEKQPPAATTDVVVTPTEMDDIVEAITLAQDDLRIVMQILRKLIFER